MQLPNIIQQFKIQGQIRQITPFGHGHIHDTFRLVNTATHQDDYLLQRINHHVFKEVAGMMNNIYQVSQYLKNQTNNPYATLSLGPTLGGSYFYRDEYGMYWRMYIFIKDVVTYDIAETESQIYEGAKAFGSFLAQLKDFPAHKLFPTIPDFHNVIFRLRNFQKAVQQDVKGRVKQATVEINYILQIATEMCQIQELGQAGKIPKRVTHNDTKFNNVLLDQQGKGKAVIDLDTVMPGYVHYDFGDGIRTTASTAAEDEADLDKIQIDSERYQAFRAGYLEATYDMLSPLELQYLPLAGPLLAYIMGLRFLTDFLEGDVYYKIHVEEQNFQRAKAQLELCKKLMVFV